jgi:AraC-like DNA-binding protein
METGTILRFDRPGTQVKLDALSKILDSFGVAGSIFSQATFGSPWSVATDPMPSGIFHVVVRGGAHLRLASQRHSRSLAAGDIVLMPHGDGHVMAGDPKLEPIPITSLYPESSDETLARVDYPGARGGDGKSSCSILCGTIRFDNELGQPMTQLLPSVIHVRGATVADWIDSTIRMLSHEANRAMPGGDVVLSKLAEMLFVQVLRGYIAQLDEDDAPRGWIAGLKDPRVGRAMALIHEQPGERWTADSLARRVGMSRSSLFARFTELVGDPPTQYLTAWRMHLAKSELRKGELGIAEIAQRVGYGSEGAFAKAFKREVGATPGEYRLAHGGRAATGS